ncbi:DUF421 domain-containing protein [Selenomonadales bacterium 4137-cl]|uniref:DUF421 domain-containing protein n=1 Tax=Anaeroselena agilis TaxID=3063788 RepID=A0ABU3P2X6_9FIRM|nr:DUF421 domain-containing protein [Selenomonadales bacterium 4137-cl]
MAQLTLYDYVVGLVIGDIGAAVAVDRAIPVIEGAVSLVACTVWILIFNFAMLHNVPARKLIEPDPVMVIYNGRILENNLSKTYYTVNNLLELLREREIFDPGRVSLGIIESDGELSIVQKDRAGENTETFHVHMSGRALVIDGRIIDRAFEHQGLSKDWLLDNIARRNIGLEEVMVAVVTPEGKLYIDTRDDRVGT